MRFVRVKVRNFRGIEAATLDFGPGLNVLFGENDLGKSTIASAIRAALLLPVGSTAWQQFVPLHRGVSPFVELTFVDDSERTWKVTKAFNIDHDGESTLAYSSDGHSFSVDGRGAEVERKLREQLKWGIAGAGGAAGTRGMPRSFLAKALLSEQTDVAGILRASLAGDSDESGKLRLASALSAFTEDDRVRAVLEKAQEERDLYFTSTGRHKSGKGSPFVALKAELAARRELKAKLETEWNQAQTGRAELEAIEGQLDVAVGRRDELRESVARAETLWRENQRHGEASAAHETAARGLATIEGIERAVAELQLSLSHAREQLTARKSDKADAEKLVEEARTGKADADQLKRANESEAGANETLLEQARTAQHVSELERDLQALESRRERVRDGEAAAAALVVACERLRVQEEEIELAGQRLKASAIDVDSARGDVERARQWKVFAEIDQLAEQLVRMSDAQARADALEGQAGVTSARLHQTAALLEASRAPQRAVLRDISALEQKRLEVRSRMSAGLEAVLEILAPTAILTSCDDSAAESVYSGPHPAVVVEADRTISIRIPGVANIRIATGTAEQRVEYGRIEALWIAQGAPVLAEAGVATVGELEAAVERHENLERELSGAKADQQRQEEEIDRLRTSVNGQAEVQAALDAKRTSVAAVDRDLLRSEIRNTQATAGVAGPDEAGLLEIARQLETKHQVVVEQGITLRSKADRLREEVTELSRRKAAIEQAMGRSTTEEAQCVEVAIAEKLRTLDLTKRRVAELEEQGRRATQAAAAAVALAQEQLDARIAALQAASEAHEQALSKVSELEGKLAEKSAQVEGTRRAMAEAAVVAAKAALTAAPAPAEVVDEAMVEQSRAAFAAQDEEVRRLSSDRENKRGALAQTGGDVARLRLEEATDALERAQDDLEIVELDADAVKLLVEVLVEAQKSSSQHVGVQLAKPIEARFHRLTNGRYERVRINPDLSAADISLGGVSCEHGNLSVGTSEQLATILRLVIAEHLGAPIVLDDHLVQSDRARLKWFSDALRSAAAKTQVIVMTCRGDDYLSEAELPTPGESHADRAGGALRAIDLERLVERWRPEQTDPQSKREAAP